MRIEARPYATPLSIYREVQPVCTLASQVSVLLALHLQNKATPDEVRSAIDNGRRFCQRVRVDFTQPHSPEGPRNYSVTCDSGITREDEDKEVLQRIDYLEMTLDEVEQNASAGDLASRLPQAIQHIHELMSPYSEEAFLRLGEVLPTY